MNPLNILYIHSHDTGRYIQPYGHAIPTPNLQRLSREGVLFRQAFCAAPVCSASRSALLTGQPPHCAGMLGLAHRGWRLNDYRQHLAPFLGAAGYRTILAGIQHEAPNPAASQWGGSLSRQVPGGTRPPAVRGARPPAVRGARPASGGAALIGYQEELPTASNQAALVAPAAAAFLDQYAAGSRTGDHKPFFLSVGFFETHREYPPPGPQDDPRCLRPPAPLPDLPEVRQDMASFAASARALDDGVGQVLAALEASGLAGSTLVISTTDHGIAFPGMKCSLTDHGLGVYLMLRCPGRFGTGLVVDEMVSHLDIYPTVCGLLELDPPAWLKGGVSLLPLLRGETARPHDELFGEVTYHAAYEPLRSVRTSRWKYIRRFDGRSRRVLPNCDDSPSKTAWLARGWAERRVDAEQLYDLVFDPNEADNLAGRVETAAELADMRARLEHWMQATADPLLNGPVPAPAGALVNDPDGLSPRDATHTIQGQF